MSIVHSHKQAKKPHYTLTISFPKRLVVRPLATIWRSPMFPAHSVKPHARWRLIPKVVKRRLCIIHDVMRGLCISNGLASL